MINRIVFQALACFLILTASPSPASEARIWVGRTVSPTTIYREGSPANTEVTVTLTGWASGDSLVMGNPFDMVFCVDGGPKMQKRSPGDPHNWASPNRIEGAYNASTNFLDTFMVSTLSRSALLRFSYSSNRTAVDVTYGYSNDRDYAKSVLDASLVGGGSGNATWLGLISSITYAAKNYRSGFTTAVLLLTTQNDRDSPFQNEQAAINRTYFLLDSLRKAGKPIRVYIVGTGNGVSWDNNMETLADSSGGTYAISVEGKGLDSLFQDIGEKLMDIVAVRVSPTSPMLVDVLAPGIHYVPGSYVPTTGGDYITPRSFSVDTVSGLTRLKFAIDTVKIGQFFEVSYRITAAVAIPDSVTSVVTRTNNTQSDNPANFSFLQFKTVTDSTVLRTIGKNYIVVKSGTNSLRLSLSPDSLVLPSPTKLIPLAYTASRPAVYPPTTFYALLGMDFGTSIQYRSATVSWNFIPRTGWVATVLSNAQADSARLTISVPFDNSGLCTLVITMPFQGEVLRDYLIFSAYDSANFVERPVSIVIDDDTTTPAFIDPPRMTVTGNRTEIAAFSRMLYARAVTNLGNIRPLSAAWSVSGFAIYQSQLSAVFSGTHAFRPLGLVVPAASFAQSDSGMIRIDSAGLSFSFELVIQDTTDYDTSNAVVIYDTAYGNNLDTIAAHYADQSRAESYSFQLGDSVTFYAMTFDVNGAQVRTLGPDSAWWQLNDQPPVRSPRFGYSGRDALQNDRIIVSYVNVWGQTARDTVFVRWGFGSMRYLSLEARPGTVGDTASYPLQSFTVPLNADTVWGVYAVIRDEYGNCVYSGGEENFTKYVTWNANPAGVLTYVDVPSETTSVGFVHRKGNPSVETVFYLRASGVDFEGLLGQADSVQVRLTLYTFDGLRIVAGASVTPVRDTTGHVYAAGTEIPGTAVLEMTAQQDTMNLKAMIRRSDTQQWIETSVEWRLTDYSCFLTNVLPSAPAVTLSPEGEIARDTLVASFTLGAAVLADTVRFRVSLPWIDSVIILCDTAGLVAGDTLTFTILTIDASGDTVRTPARLPPGFQITVDQLALLLGARDTVWLDDTTFLVIDPFTNGVSSNRLAVYTAGGNTIRISLSYPGRSGTVTVTQTFSFNVLPAAPDSMAVVKPGGTSPVAVDTLTTSGGAGSPISWWEIRLYDAYGNLLPADDPRYDSVQITVTGGPLSASYFVRDSNRIGYDNSGLSQGGRSTVTLTYHGADGDLVCTFDLVVLSLARLLSVSTHEWISDTVGNIRGYQTFRDGFLDYLDLSFSIPVWLKADFITSIRFRTDEDSVLWPLAASGQAVELLSLDPPSRDSLHARYRLWLLSNALQREEPLETGFLPVLTISNALIKQGSASEPILVGDGADEYVCPDSLVRDSAPPVISRFLFKDNGCQAEKTPNVITIFFSEPVRNTAFPSNDNLTALALLYRGRADSTFMATSILSGKRSERVGNAMEAWNYNGSTDRMMAYEARINADSNRNFTPDVTHLRFSLNPSNRQVLDGAGNSACISASRAVRMKAERDNSDFVCSVNGLSTVSRLDAMTFSWGPSNDPAAQGAQAPLFPFFGFTVNLQSLTALMQGGGTTISLVTVDGRDYVVCDYDTAYVLVESQALVYDLLGNLTASPASHEALHQEYTFGDIRRALGMDDVRENLSTMTLSEIEEYYYVTESVNPGAPDTLRPVYPQTFTLGYDYMKEICGPGASTSICVPAWNCLNAKGRLVAPGGYVIVQTMRTGNTVSEVTRKLIVTDMKK